MAKEKRLQQVYTKGGGTFSARATQITPTQSFAFWQYWWAGLTSVAPDTYWLYSYSPSNNMHQNSPQISSSHAEVSAVSSGHSPSVHLPSDSV